MVTYSWNSSARTGRRLDHRPKRGGPMSVAPKHLVRLATLAAVMTVCVLVMRANGASSFVLVHLFYFPIILAAFWYREVGGALGGALAGVATGPLLLADATPSEYAAGAWLARTFFFVAIGLTVGAGRALLRARRRRLEEHVAHLGRTYARTLKSLVYLLEHHDEETANHCDRVAANAIKLGSELGLGAAELEDLYWAAYLHDIGKLATPARMLLKEGPLDAHEYEVMKQHASIGANTLADISPDFETVAAAVRAHHERWDGRGYPDGLAGERIPLFGRVLAVVDAFEAMTSDRPYRAAMSVQAAAQVLEEEAGRQFDPALVTVYLRLIEAGEVHTEAGDGKRTGLELPEAFSLRRKLGTPRVPVLR